MKDLAAYYAYLPRMSAYHPPSAEPSPAVVMSGSPMRNIAPCASCHGGLSDKAGSPWLEGQSAIYLRVELDAFATGARHNDISGQMRNVARQMTRPKSMQPLATIRTSRSAMQGIDKCIVDGIVKRAPYSALRATRRCGLSTRYR